MGCRKAMLQLCERAVRMQLWSAQEIRDDVFYSADVLGSDGAVGCGREL
jgi:hypothetical protein